MPLSMEAPGDGCPGTVDQVTGTPSPPATREESGSSVLHVLGTAAMSLTQGSPGRLSVLELLRKSGPPSRGPLGTKLPRASGVASEDEANIRESRRQTKETECLLFPFECLPPATPEASPSPGPSVTELLSFVSNIILTNTEARGGGGKERWGGRWWKGRKEGKRLRRGKGSKFRESRFPGIWFTYWVYM